MRILFVAPSYYPHVGGVEYVVKSIAERLAKAGHEVSVLAGEAEAEAPREEEINGVRVVRWPVWSPGGAYHFPRQRGRLEELVRAEARAADVIHLHNVHSVFAIYALRAVANAGARKILTPYYHGTGHTALREFLWIPWRVYVKKMLKYINIIHTVSKREAKLVEKDFNTKAIPIENGVEEWILNVQWRPESYVMYSGRIEKYKNIHRLANIVKILNQKYKMEIDLRIFGKGPFRDKLEQYLKKLGVPFTLQDPQPFEKYIEHLSHARIFALLSEKESYPQSINEANALGTPAVTAEPWGENFAGRTRTLIVSLKQSDEAIADAIAQFLEKAQKEPRPQVPTWDEVTKRYVAELYNAPTT